MAQICGVDTAIGLKGCAAAKQANPLQILITVVCFFCNHKKIAIINIQKFNCSEGALNRATHLDELPSFPVIHCSVRNALEEMKAVENGGKKLFELVSIARSAWLAYLVI